MRELAVLQILERRVREQEMFEASRRVDEIRSFALGDVAFDITDCLAIETGLLLRAGMSSCADPSTVC